MNTEEEGRSTREGLHKNKEEEEHQPQNDDDDDNKLKRDDSYQANESVMVQTDVTCHTLHGRVVIASQQVIH